MIGIAHSVRKSFPALIPEVIAKMGFSAKNNMKQAATPSSPFMNVTASHGNANMTTDDAISHDISFFMLHSQISH